MFIGGKYDVGIFMEDFGIVGFGADDGVVQRVHKYTRYLDLGQSEETRGLSVVVFTTLIAKIGSCESFVEPENRGAVYPDLFSDINIQLICKIIFQFWFVLQY